jgi:hypothetical protein
VEIHPMEIIHGQLAVMIDGGDRSGKGRRDALSSQIAAHIPRDMTGSLSQPGAATSRRFDIMGAEHHFEL